jgi:hypothetical protein
MTEQRVTTIALVASSDHARHRGRYSLRAHQHEHASYAIEQQEVVRNIVVTRLPVLIWIKVQSWTKYDALLRRWSRLQAVDNVDDGGDERGGLGYCNAGGVGGGVVDHRTAMGLATHQ